MLVNYKLRPLKIIIISLFGSAIQWNPSFSNHLGKGGETSGVKLQCLTSEEKLRHVCLNYWSFQKTTGSRNLDSTLFVGNSFSRPAMSLCFGSMKVTLWQSVHTHAVL